MAKTSIIIASFLYIINNYLHALEERHRYDIVWNCPIALNSTMIDSAVRNIRPDLLDRYTLQLSQTRLNDRRAILANVDFNTLKRDLIPRCKSIRECYNNHPFVTVINILGSISIIDSFYRIYCKWSTPTHNPSDNYTSYLTVHDSLYAFALSGLLYIEYSYSNNHYVRTLNQLKTLEDMYKQQS